MKGKMKYSTFIAAGIRNKPGRNIATIFCFFFIAANIFSGQFLIAGAASGVDSGLARMGADHMVVPPQYMIFLKGAGPNNTVAIVMAEPSNFRMKADIMGEIKNVPGVGAVSPQVYITTLNLPDLSPDPVNIYGIDPVTDFTVRPWLQKPLDKPIGPGEVIVGHGIKGDISTRILMGTMTYTIAGKLDPTQSSIDNAVILRMDDSYALAATRGAIASSAPGIEPGDVNAILIRDSRGDDKDAVGLRIRRMLISSPEYRSARLISRHFSLDPVSEDIQAIPGLLSIISVFVVIIALPLIILITAMVANERRKEIGLLKSMGAKRNTIFLLVTSESIILAAIGGITGIISSFLAIFILNSQGVLNSALQVSFRMPTFGETGAIAGMALAAVIIIGGISSLWPAYKSSTMSPYDAIRD